MCTYTKTLRRFLIGLVLGCVLALPAGAAFKREDLVDTVSQLQYAWYTGDLTQLLTLAEMLGNEKPRVGLERWLKYYSAYGYYRAAQLADENYFSDYIERCEDTLKPVLKEHADFSEGLILRGSCAALLTERKPIAAIFAPSRALRAFKKAALIDPNNPRLKLQQAVASLGRKALAEHFQSAPTLLAEALEQFSRRVEPDALLPDWGEAEANLLLARLALDTGDKLRARDAIESAIQIVPDFQEAHEMLAVIRGGAR